jgi:ATP-dependent helicase HrpB
MRAWKYAENNRFDPNRCRRLGIHAQTARQAGELFAQFLEINERAEKSQDAAPPPDGDRSTAIARCVLAGFSDQVARRLDLGTLRCQLVGNRRGVLARESAVQKAPLFVAGEVREVQNRGEELTTLLSLATAIDERWLSEMFPGDFSEDLDVFFEPEGRRVQVRRQRRFRDLPLAVTLSDDPPKEQAAALLASEVLAGRCPLKNWDAAVDQWIARLNSLASWMPDLTLPRMDADGRRALIEQICYGATTYKAIKERSVWPAVRAWLSPQQQEWLETYAPERIPLTTSKGARQAKLTYADASDGAPPVLAARIQDLYGVTGGLRVASGRIPVVIQVLAPNHRPIQVTQDLANFWRESYPKIKPELQRKYPKHEWR